MGGRPGQPDVLLHFLFLVKHEEIANTNRETSSDKGGNDMSAYKWQGTASGVLIGLGVGVGLGILLAPKSGRETRDQIVGSVRDGIDGAVAQGRNMSRRAQRAIEAARENISDAADAGEQAYKQAKSTVS